MMPLLEVLDLARWAPSGDNTQPWRFSIEATDRIAVLGHDTRDHCVYDLDGHASQVSLGALLETISISATRFGLRAHVAPRAESPVDRPIFDVTFKLDPGCTEDQLVAEIRTRSVQRRPFTFRRLSKSQRQTLERAVQPGYEVVWFETWSDRLKVAWLNFVNAKIRLTIPEAYAVHKAIIAWDAQFSEDRIPSAALGASRSTLRAMRWGLESWNRIDFLNHFLAGSLPTRIELDLIPGLACGAHCVLLADCPPVTIDDYVAAGRAVQRFWLTVTALGLQFQPQYTPLVFARYAREGRHFSAHPHALRQAENIGNLLGGLLKNSASRAVFMGRIGVGKQPTARSIRLPLERLLQPSRG